MRKFKWQWLFTTILVATASAASCTMTPITEQPPPAKTTPSTSGSQTTQSSILKELMLPIINSFTTSPSTVYTGQPVTLSWNVTDATSVSIQPTVGNVDLSGTKQVTPTRSISYTLIASNADGTVMSTRTVMLITPQGTPDLTITHMWTTGAIMYFNVKNLGTGTSQRCTAYLYLSGLHVATAYVQPLAPGEQRIEEFPNYVFPTKIQNINQGAVEWTWDFKVCVDTENQVSETDKNNNCFEQVLGATLGTAPWQKPQQSPSPQLKFNIFPQAKATITTQ